MYYKLLNNKSNFLIKRKVFVPTGTSELLIGATGKIVKIKLYLTTKDKPNNKLKIKNKK